MRRCIGQGQTSTQQVHLLEFGMARKECQDGFWTAIRFAVEEVEGRLVVPPQTAHDQSSSHVLQFFVRRVKPSGRLSRNLNLKAEALEAGEGAEHFRNPGGHRPGDPPQRQVDAVHMHVLGCVPDNGLNARIKVGGEGSGVAAAAAAKAELPVTDGAIISKQAGMQLRWSVDGL